MTASRLDSESWYWPLKSVIHPLSVPFSKMVTPISGFPSLSTMVPLTFFFVTTYSLVNILL